MHMCSLYMHSTVFNGAVRMAAYDEAKSIGMPRPAAHVESLKLKGYYRCCFYKWQRVRRNEHWTLICSSNPALAKKYRELPNSLRSMVGRRLKFRGRSGTEPTTTVSIPKHLEDTIVECVVSWQGIGDTHTHRYIEIRF